MNSKFICLIGDLHFGTKKNSEVYFESQKKFLVNQLIPYLKERNIKKIFFLGDMFDNRSSINTKIHNEVFNLFNDYFKEFEIVILVGNHDTYYNSSIETNSIKFLGKFENIKIIEVPEIMECDNKKILLTPWIINFSEFVSYISDKSFDISFGHYNILGFHYNKFKTSEDGLDGSLFGNKCKKVFSGHFHIRSKQTFKNCDIVYIGSPYQLTRTDIDEERGFTILNTDDWSYEFINNNVSIKFIKLEYPKMFNRNLIEGNIIDVHVKYDKNYVEEKVDNYIKQINEFNPAFQPQIVIETDGMMDSNFDITKLNFSSIPDLMMEYINTIDIKNREEVFNILIDLFNVTK
jgi:DNA repair exonuclease SbcCD nuclease subunit